MKIYITAVVFVFCFNAIAQKQELEKDTLFIKYDDSLLNREKIMGKDSFLYRIKGTGNNGFVYLTEEVLYNNLKPREVICFKEVLKNSNAYYKSIRLKGKLDDWELANYLRNYTLFLVQNRYYTKVKPWFEIE